MERLLRIETYLLAAPLVLLVAQLFLFSDLTFDIHLYDTMYVTSLWLIFAGVFLVHMIFWAMHAVLRFKKRRNRAVCIIHVSITVATLMLAFMPLLILNNVVGGSDPADVIERVLWRGTFSDISVFLLALFLFSHLVFIFYFLIVMLKKQKPRAGNRHSLVDLFVPGTRTAFFGSHPKAEPSK